MQSTVVISTCSVQSVLSSHKEALKRIGRYLKRRRDRCLILNPICNKDGNADVLQIDDCLDADFAGTYEYEENTNPVSVKSRTGVIITFAKCPVLWILKLQTETDLSTMEVEIVSLVHSCREVFPIMHMVGSLGPALRNPAGDTTMKDSVHEDNNGTLILAQTLSCQ